MNNHHIKLFTGVALIAVFVLQAIWLYNTYSVLGDDLQNKLDKTFSQSIEKEIYYRLNNKDRDITGESVEGASPDLDSYLNALYFNEFLYSHNIPFDFKRLDSIFNNELVKDVGVLNYSLELLDNKDQTIKKVYNRIHEDLLNPFFIKTMPIRLDKSELVRVSIESPYKIIFQKMLLLLIASLVIGLIIIYCIFSQIKIITKQDRIAEIRQDFTHAMIHDMKNPITTILMGINALKGGKLNDKELLKEQYYNIISNESEHLLGLTNKILTIAQFEEKRVTLSKDNIDIRLMFDNLMEKYKLDSEESIQIITEYNDVSEIYADEGYMYEAFNNLIDNAVKYSKGNVVISIICSKDISNTTIKIKDNGIGISLKDQKRIFEKFERIHLSKRKHISGFGLGLNFVYQVVTAHEGDIKLNSVLNSYSEFAVIIPNKKNDKTSVN
ncbi:two-component system phosphate regulon sensor histidine kinase PhoR [Dysgonomonas alginatilytica]|uniref:histidine kinase n=1 Tax=Dysgonomonas alginatilytica TaxID=1605892 RepID=A0A2V3PQG2_9BACT|nr:HAMP domain-containing sensor histidine kinase [Dysgonomonas alginatilytica]PXV59340.1 two-component system phosphate regulon sensor histidine kinase PhoR [Dysgonomonas alginatilytica]